MADLWFFLSYARFDRDDDPHNCIRRFYEDLDTRVRLKTVTKEAHSGFYDGTSIQQGDEWPLALVEALGNCRIMICMYSPAYFASEYCGRESGVFDQRLVDHAKASKTVSGKAPLIKPVMLDPPQDLKPPKTIADIQMFDDDYPAVYREEGLRYLMRRNDPKLKDIYEDLLDVITHKLLEAAKSHLLPALPSLPDIKQVTSIFHPRLEESGVDEKSADTAGPVYADFIYVAGKRAEIQTLGRNVENYGDEGGLDWKPYLPGVMDEVAIAAQTVASRERFRYRHVPLSENIVDLIEEAQKNNRVVIIIVDTWTLCLPDYRDLMRKYDTYSFWNCAVLIAWNDKDDDTMKKRPTLEAAIRKAFVTKARSKDPNYFIDNVGSHDDLMSNLSIALQKVKFQIIDVTNDLRKIEGDLIAKPEITGPGATVHGS
jgi:FxsC-like protein